MIKFEKIKNNFNKFLSIFFILIIIVLNPLTLEPFSPDQQLDFLTLIDILMFDLFFLVLTVLFFVVNKKAAINIILLFVTTILVVGTIELTFYLIDPVNDKTDVTEGHYIINSIKSSYNQKIISKNLFNTSINVKKIKNNGKIIFDTNYNFDQFARRKTPKKTEGEHLLIFGGSFAFGVGLKDDQTLPYFLSEKTNFQVYNYAYPGYGAHQMLAKIEREKIADEVLNKNGVAIYIFIPTHIRRAIGDMFYVNTSNPLYPYYHMVNGEVVRNKTFITGRTFTTWIYRVLWKSKTVRYFNLNLPAENDEQVQLIYKMIKRTKDIYQEKFKGNFYVLFHPLVFNTNQSDYLFSLLKNNNVNTLVYPIEHQEDYFILGDGHPTEKFNKILANLIANDLK